LWTSGLIDNSEEGTMDESSVYDGDGVELEALSDEENEDNENYEEEEEGDDGVSGGVAATSIKE